MLKEQNKLLWRICLLLSRSCSICTLHLTTTAHLHHFNLFTKIPAFAGVFYALFLLCILCVISYVHVSVIYFIAVAK